jgi:hypothetical protein
MYDMSFTLLTSHLLISPLKVVLRDFCGECVFNRNAYYKNEFVIETLEGDMHCKLGDTSISNPVVTAALPPATVYRINSSFAVNSDTAPFGVSAE